MFQYPYMNLFFFTLFSSTIMAISSSHWLMVWMALELNMISFIPMIASSNWFQESEAALKYLLFQALGSSLLLLGMMNPFIAALTFVGLLVKLGAAPFHFWFPSMMKSLPWPTAALLMTWQKIAPMALIISSFSLVSSFMPFVGVIGALVGGLGGLTQTHFRALLAYSSIGHMGWMIALSSHSPLMAFFYLGFYIFISIPVLVSSHLANIQSVKAQSRPTQTLMLLILLPCVLSLSGLPPFLGFIPKLAAILSFSSYALPLCLILGSLINLSYYLNFFFSTLMTSSSPKQGLHTGPLTVPLVTMFWLASSPVPLIFIALSFM
uniref:NADH-ubiquinone oxidoreductase chain 2 n=1 Tax=Prionospio sp. 1 MH-2023 TaxID=3058460 RepID=A0AAU6QGF1_9ANNE